MIKEVKESMKTISHQIKNIKLKIEIIKKNKIEILEILRIVIANENLTRGAQQ